MALGPAVAHGVSDYDLDGVDEVLVGTTGQTVLVDAAEGGGLSSWDLRASRTALASVLRRRPEAYHEQLRTFDAAAERDAAETISPHEVVQVKEANLSKFLVYDRDERRSGLVRVFVGDELGDWVRAAWAVVSASESAVVLGRSEAGLSMTKSVGLGGDRLAPTLTVVLEVVAGRQSVEGKLTVEWNLNLQGGGANPQAYYRWAEEEARHDSAGRLAANAPNLSFGNTWLGVDVRSSASPPAGREWYPVETVSNSEAGYERVYQGSCLTFSWPLRLAPGEKATFSVRFDVEQAPDLTRA
jgi:4-alpha-glucanotransferase